MASVLLEEETGVPEENHRLAASHRQTLSHKVVSNTPLLSGILTHNASYIFKYKIYCVVTIDANRKLYLHIGNYARFMFYINICLKINNRKTVL